MSPCPAPHRSHAGAFFAPPPLNLPPKERSHLTARVNGLLDGTLDGVSFKLSQAFFFGGIEGKPTPKTVLVEGRYIDQARDLDAGATGRRSRVTPEGDTVAASDESGFNHGIPTRVQSQLPHLSAHDVDTLDRALRDTLTELGNNNANA